jgi:hypothetical protein
MTISAADIDAVTVAAQALPPAKGNYLEPDFGIALEDFELIERMSAAGGRSAGPAVMTTVGRVISNNGRW